uniref:Uncharacterized protein n=1 Tax=Anguilla anguilla TaxID=7936 RepID=A0A0E9QQX9_ANGAN
MRSNVEMTSLSPRRSNGRAQFCTSNGRAGFCTSNGELGSVPVMEELGSVERALIVGML